MSIILYVFLTVLACNSFGATTTDRHILGFSKDGRYFVFEEFAVSDDAGIPQATLFAIDTTNNSWVPGTPVSADHDEDDFPEKPGQDYADVDRELIETVHRKVREKAKSVLE